MAKYEIELTDLEDKCMTYVIDGTKDWIDLALKARARKAKDEIVLLNMKHCNTNGIAIAENEEKQVQQAFDLKIVKTAKEREAEFKLPE
jgi:rRNA maturation protein Rpf1|tara:strand:- start:9 stop:275 length:267 start_codon:yes stop_codon:yes gene_type:complete